MKITIIYSGVENSYLVGLVSGLSNLSHLKIDVIDSDNSIGKFDDLTNVNFLNYRGSLEPGVGSLAKVNRILKYYLRLIIYAYKTDSKLLHIQWMNKFIYFDRTILNLYYKILGKKLIFTAHNINAKKRNNRDNILNRLSLMAHYKLMDHIIVHNNKMKEELINEFNISKQKVSVISFGLNVKAPQIVVSKQQAISYLGLPENKKYILFFGGIINYKGLDVLINAFKLMLESDNSYHLIIAGNPREQEYFQQIEKLLNEIKIDENCTRHFKYIPDLDIPYYFYAADCCVLPYKSIFQSGVHTLSYAYGLPVIASDVGSFKDDDVLENETGFIFKPLDHHDLKMTLIKYFKSPLYLQLPQTRIHINNWAQKKYSWIEIGKKTSSLYQHICNNEKLTGVNFDQ